MPAIQLLDSAGAPISLGQTVKVVGVVTAVNPFNNRRHEVTITLTNHLNVEDTQVAPGGANSVPGSALTRTISLPSTDFTIGA